MVRLKRLRSVITSIVWIVFDITTTSYLLLLFNSFAGSVTVKNTWKVHGGQLTQLIHSSTSTLTEMRFSVFLPSTASSAAEASIPALYWLSGLTCTDENFAQKATAAFKVANKLNIAIVLPDTSPRGANCEGDKESWDFGEGAGFYLNATNPAYSTHYNMDTYVSQELHSVVQTQFPCIGSRRSVMGHSMGGHGALTLYLRHVGLFESVSAFAPISNPMNCPWGKKAFSKYFGEQTLGNNGELWASHDATELVKTFEKRGGDISKPILIHQGLGDNFYKQGQLLPESLIEACKTSGVELQYHGVEGYDHSYFFISTFIEEHVEFHGAILNSN